MNAEQLRQQMISVQTDMVFILRSKDGIQQLYNAACWINDGQSADKYRFELHDLLDKELDKCARIMQLTKQHIQL